MGDKRILKNHIEKFSWGFALILIVFALFLGGLGLENFVAEFVGLVVGITLTIALFWQKKNIKIPQAFLLYTAFLVFFLIQSVFISQDVKKSLLYFILFLSGGFFWLVSFNRQRQLSGKIEKLILILGLVFGVLFIKNQYFGEIQVKPWSLYAQYSFFKNHSHIGDFWAIVLSTVIFRLLKNPKNTLYWFMVPLGIYFLATSLSRSAYAALAVGAIYLTQTLSPKVRQIFLRTSILLVLILFLFSGAQKPTLFIRPYFLQGIIGFFKYPQGVGMGNFGIISKESTLNILGLSGFSSVAHNIFLEVMVGVGVLGIIFVFWFAKVITKILATKDKEGFVYRLIFIVISINFFFDSTYFVPSMLWLWFISLGLVQRPKVVN